TTHKLQCSTHYSVKALANDINDRVHPYNQDPTPFIWHKTADQILERLGRYCAAILGTDLHNETT
ncbi:MAG: hypothetical protein GY788_16355, partial [bacterium]|nr:hypothetical protein [bacterium]